ncbi:MAG: hypothetical protein J0H65_08000 [Rhizobiales bacterium]|nr:hypothetical protein [Hyphomicrobiales bacterium]
MRYYFHLESDANIHIDHRGLVFAEAAEAKAHAHAVARKLSMEDKWLGWKVRVIDAANVELCCLTILDEARFA